MFKRQHEVSYQVISYTEYKCNKDLQTEKETDAKYIENLKFLWIKNNINCCVLPIKYSMKIVFA
jgi:hypothetical protein